MYTIDLTDFLTLLSIAYMWLGIFHQDPFLIATSMFLLLSSRLP